MSIKRKEIAFNHNMHPLILRHFSKYTSTALNKLSKSIDDYESYGQKYEHLATDSVAEFIEDFSTESFVLIHLPEIIRQSVAANDIIAIKNILKFRDGILKIDNNLQEIVGAIIDEHIPARYRQNGQT